MQDELGTKADVFLLLREELQFIIFYYVLWDGEVSRFI